MRFTLFINQAKSVEWGLSFQQAALFSCLYELQSWGKYKIIDGHPYYWAGKNKIIEEIPLVFDKPDTLKRHMIALEKLGLIERKQLKNMPYVRITEKGKEWNKAQQSDDESKGVKKITTSEKPCKKSRPSSEKDHDQPVKKITTISVLDKNTRSEDIDPEQIGDALAKPTPDESKIIEVWNELGCQKHRGVTKAAAKAILKTYDEYCKGNPEPKEITTWALAYLKNGFAKWMSDHHRNLDNGQWCADLEFAMRFSTYDKVKNTELD